MEMDSVDPCISADPKILDGVLDATRLLVLVLDGQGRVVAANRAFEDATGFSREALRTPIWELVTVPEERTLIRAAFDPLRSESFPSSVLLHLGATGAAPRVVDWDARVIEDGPGRPIVVLHGIDLSGRIAAQQHLGEAEAFRRLILDRLPAVIWTTDAELRFTSSSGAGLANLELVPEQVSAAGTSLFAYFQTRDPSHPAIAPHVRALRGESTAFEVEKQGRRFRARVDPLRDRREHIVGTIGIAFDVTEQERTSEALRLSEGRLQRLIDSDVIGMLFGDETGRIMDANDALLRLLGFTRDDLTAGRLSWSAITPAEYRAADERALTELRCRGRFVPYEKELTASDGTRVPILIGGVTMPASPGDSMQCVAFVLDMREDLRLREARDHLLVTERAARIETERANTRILLLAQCSVHLSTVRTIDDTLQTMASLVVPSLADWSFIVHRGWNGGPSLMASAHGDPNKRGTLRRLYGCPPHPDAPEGASRVYRTGEAALYSDITPEQLSAEAPAWPIVGTRDAEHLRALRELGLKSLLCVPIRGRNTVDGVMMLASARDPHRYDRDDVGLAQDLADRAAVTLENARLLAEAIDATQARDEFLMTAAHELRTPLTSFLLQIQLLGQTVERGELAMDAAKRAVARCERQAWRLTDLVNQLLDVARVVSHQLNLRIEEVDLRQLLDGLLAQLSADFQRAGCAVSLQTPDGIVGRWDRGRIEHVLTNLLSNAMKFGAGHPIEVKVERADASVTISVRDHGIGIAKEDRTRILARFERAVPTRHFGGMGLGLYISVQILLAHRGSLRVESELGQGSCFIVDLPTAMGPATAGPPAN